MTGSQGFAFDDDGDDEDLPEAVRNAEAAVAALARNFTEWMRADLEKAQSALAAAKASQPDNASQVREIYEVCHNIKGQGGSFGYDLITNVAELLCNYIHDAESASERMLKIVEAHLTAVQFILDRDIQGDGGPVGNQLLDKLRSLTAASD